LNETNSFQMIYGAFIVSYFDNVIYAM